MTTCVVHVTTMTPQRSADLHVTDMLTDNKLPGPRGDHDAESRDHRAHAGESDVGQEA